MAKYIWHEGRWVPREEFRRPASRIHVIPDVQAFRSPVDGSVISSRSALREHERRHDVRQIGNDWAGGGADYGCAKPENWRD